MPSSVKPSAYPALPFHLIRFFIFLSALVVDAILAVFIYHLHADGFKLPYSFIVLLVTAALSLANLILTSIIHCSCSLSTKLSLALNIILTILWALSLGLMGWSMAGSITTSCTTAVWGNSAGITVCRSYKALFTFTITGLASHIAAIWLDVVVRRRETRFGNYGAMGSGGLDDTGAFDAKMDDRRDSTPLQDFHDLPAMHEGQTHYQHDAYPDGQSYGHAQGPYERNDHAYGDAQEYYDNAPASRPRVRFGLHDQAYQRPAEQTGYDPAMYR